MAKYIFDNEPFSEEELLEIAKERSVTLQELLEKNPEIKLSDDETEVTEEVITDPTKEGKEKPTTGEDATVVEEIVAPEPTPVTEFKPVDISLGLPEVKTGTVESTEEVNKVYEKAAEEVPEALDKILKAREEISTSQIKAQTAKNYFNLEEVNKAVNTTVILRDGSALQKPPTQEEKEERIYDNGLNMPNATSKSAQEYLDTYKNYIKTGELTPTNNQKEYLTIIQNASKEQVVNIESELISGNYPEATQLIVENLINKNKDFKTEEEADFYVDKSTKIFFNREKKLTKNIEQLNINVNKLKNEINFIDEQLKNLNKKNNNFQNPAEYTQNSVDQYNNLVNKRNSLIKSPQAQALEVQQLNLSQEQSSLIDFQRTVTNKVLKFQNEESALKALEKDYSFSTRAALKMEQAFGGFGGISIAMLAKAGAELITPGKYGGGFATVALDEKRENTLIKSADNFLTSQIDYNRALEEKIAKILPTSVTVKQVGEGKAPFSRLIFEAIANGSPTLVASLGPAGAVRLGSRLAGQAMLKPAMARAAANLSAVLLANQAGGGEMSSLLIAKEDAPLRIAQLEETLKSAKDPVEVQKINNEIATLRSSMNLSTAKIGFAGVLSAGIEGFTERFGTLALINKAAPYIPGQSTVKKILAGGKAFGKGLLQENVEEVIAGISNNILVQNALLKKDVNVFEGIDLDMIANTTVVSAVMLGQGFGANTRSAILELTTNVEEAKRFQSLTRKLIDLQSSNSTDKRKQTKKILQQLGLENMISLAKLNTMNPQELQKLGNVQTQINKLNREASMFGVSMSQKGEITAADRNTLKKMEQQFEVLRSQKNDLLKTRRGGLAAVESGQEATVDRLINNPRFNFYSNAYNAFKVLTESMMPKGGKYIEFKNAADLKFTEEQKQSFLKDFNSDKKAKDKLKTFEEAVMRINAWQDGNNIYVNLKSIQDQIITDSNDSASFAVASPLHELSHIRNSNLKLNKRLVNKAVDDAIKIIENNKNNLNKKDYESILARFKLYQNTESNYEEFMQVLSDAQTTGLINLSDYIDINSFKDLIKYVGAKAFGDLSGIFFNIETSNDVFNYINSYRTIVKKGTRIGSSDKEEVKFSVSGYKTPEGRKIDDLVGGKDEDGNYIMTKAEWDAGGIKDAYNEVNKSDGLFQPTIRKGIQGDEIQGISRNEFDDNVKFKIVEILMKFNPEKNNSLSGYVNSLAYRRKGDALKEAKKTPTGRSLDTPAGETGSIREIGTEEEVDMDAFMAQTDATNESNITNLKLIKEEIKTSDGKKITKLKENIEREVREKGPKLTEKELTYKTSPDYGTPTILKAINDSFQNSTEFKKLYDAKSKQLDREIADGKTNREGQKISKANELQKFKTGYILRPEDFAGSGNLSQKKFPIVKDFIDQNIKLIIENLPKAAVTRKDPVSKKIENTSTGVPSNFLNNPNLYTKTEERIGNSGIFVYKKRKGITSKDIFEMLEGKPLVKGKFGLPMQNAKQFINNLGQFATNQELRLQDFITSQQSADLEGGKDSKILFSKSIELPILNSLRVGGNQNELLSIKFSKSSKDAYEKILIGRRPELRDASEQVDNLFKWVDTLDIPENKKSKHEKLALFYMGNGNLILPEDGYKVEDAIKVAAKNKLDPFSYKNPNELLEKFAGDISPKKINPDNLSTFSNKQELADGITTYEIEDSRAGQADVRKIIDSNWGKKANPWCLAALIDGNLDQAWDYWKRYSGKKQIAFQNNKLLAFNAFDQYNPLADPRWYDRMDKATEGLVFYKKINDPRGLKLKLELNTKNNSTKQIGYEVGSPESNFYQEYNVDKELITEVKRTATKETFFNDTLKSNAVEEWKDGDEGAKFDLVFYTPIENGVLEEDPIDFEDAYSDLRFWDKRTAILTVDPSTKKDRYGNRKSTNSKYIYESVNPKQKYIVQAKAGGKFGYTVEYKELNGVKFLTGRDIFNNYVVPDKEAPPEQLEFAKNLESVSKLIGTTYGQLLGEIQDTAFLLDSDNKPIIPIKFPFLNTSNKGEFEIDPINEVGKGSKIKFSGLSADMLNILNSVEIKDGYEGLETDSGIKKYASDIEKILIPLFNSSGIKIFNSTVLQFTSDIIKDSKLRTGLRAILGNLRDKGILEKKLLTGRQSINKFFGNNPTLLLKNLNNPKRTKKYNEKHALVFDTMIRKMNDLLNEKDNFGNYRHRNQLVLPLVYFLTNAISERSNPISVGARILGVPADFKIKSTKKSAKGTPLYYIYDHSFPQNQVSKLLIKSMLDDSISFEDTFKRVKENYYVVALTMEDMAEVNKKNKNKLDDKSEWYDRFENANVDLSKYIYINENGESSGSIADYVKKLKSNKAQLNLSKTKKLGKSINTAAFNNNQNLPKNKQIVAPKSWWLSEAVTAEPSQMVIDRLKKVDDRNNEARRNFSKAQDLDDTFNKIIENKTGIETYQRFDRASATVKGASKGKFNFFIPPSAEDFVGLLYKTLGKGKVGDSQMQFYKDNLLDPYGRAMNDVSSARVAMFEDYKALKEDLNIIPKDLSKKGAEEYTREQAVRVYIWDQQGNKIPGIFKTNQQKLVDYVNANPDLKQFGDQLIAMQKGDGYVTPKEGWLAGTITTDLLDSVNSIKRKKYLEQWQTNVDEMFGESNMNKLEAAFGKPYRRALEDALSRMKSGRNKKFTAGNEQVNAWTNWVNNSVGTIMFLNSRSAILQTLSTVNFLNFEDNNVFKAGAAFANQPQYWKDFKFLFNSDFLKERRGGLRFNVSESEIADAAKRGGARGVVSKILQAGFLPTQMADSFAIAAGGATFYRNRLNTYLKETDADGNKIYTEAEAQEKTFLDFRETAEESQQSSRPDRISMEQAGPLGRTILAFANTPAQYTRIMKKAALDIKNGRGSLKANISRLIYYGVVQNIIFGAIQAATFSLAFGGGDEEDQLFEEKAMRIANGTADSILRGAGLYGAIAATIKNTAIKLIKESKKSRTDYFEAGLVELAGISPPIQSKVKKWRSATKSYEYNKKEMEAKGFSIENPAYLAGANVIAAFTNLPTDRVVKKVTNVYDAIQEDVEVWKRTALLMGWSKWELEPTVKKAKTKKKKAIKKTNPRIRSRSSNSRARPSRAR